MADKLRRQFEVGHSGRRWSRGEGWFLGSVPSGFTREVRRGEMCGRDDVIWRGRSGQGGRYKELESVLVSYQGTWRGVLRGVGSVEQRQQGAHRKGERTKSGRGKHGSFLQNTRRAARRSLGWVAYLVGCLDFKAAGWPQKQVETVVIVDPCWRCSCFPQLWWGPETSAASGLGLTATNHDMHTVLAIAQVHQFPGSASYAGSMVSKRSNVQLPGCHSNYELPALAAWATSRP